MAGGGNGMNVNQANLCLTRSVCTLGISSHFFFPGETFLASTPVLCLLLHRSDINLH